MPDRNYTPSYMRPQLFSGAPKAYDCMQPLVAESFLTAGPVQPGLMSQAAALRAGASGTGLYLAGL